MAKNRAPTFTTSIPLVAVMLTLAGISVAPARSQTTQEVASNRERGVNLDLYYRCWWDSDAEFSHAGLLERPILTAGDPQHVNKPGAVLLYASKFSHAFLEPHASTQPAKHNYQEVLYVVHGQGSISGGDKKASLEDGTGVLVPPNVEHKIENDGTQTMELLILTEQPPANFKPRSDMLVRYLRLLPITHIAHWSYAVRWLFKEEDGLANLSNVLIVTQDAMTIGSPHAHVPLWEEVWYKIDEDGLLFVGSEIRKMPNGCGYISPPDGVTTHSVINVTDHPQRYFYFGHYTHPVKY
jgi:mannose-6-phosphate isomerase-like protein (cupin superfamily)